MMKYGDILKKTRIEKKLSLEDISKKLKISLSVLRGLEGASSKLPPEIITKGFIKSYCKLLDIDADQPLSEYKASIDINRKEHPLEKSKKQDKLNYERGPFFLSTFLKKKVLPVFLLIFFLVLGVFSFKVLNKAQDQEVTSLRNIVETKPLKGTIKQPPKIVTEVNPVNEEKVYLRGEKIKKVSSVGSSEEKNESADFHKLVVEPLVPGFLYIKADGDKEFIRATLKADKKRFFKFKKAEVQFVDAGAVNVIFNGKDFGTIGGVQERKTIEFPSLKGL